VVRDGIGNALVVAQKLGTGTLAADAKVAFVHAMSSTVLIAAVVALGGALVALVWLPARPAAIKAEPLAEIDAMALVD
jgi:hypothetical protein